MKITEELTSLPFDILYETYFVDNQLNLEQWIDCYNLRLKMVTYVPKMLRYITRGFLQKPELTEHLLNKCYDFNSSWDRGLYLFLQHDNRSDWLQSQVKHPGLSYAGLVPLQLLAFKQKFNVSYSSWPRTLITRFVHPKLAKAMLFEFEETTKFTSEELVELRHQGLLYKTGPKKGTHRKPTSTSKLYNLPAGKFQELPQYVQVMLTQIWCAHPELRHPNMVLDVTNWDSMPQALIANEVLVVEPKTVKEPIDLPW